MIGLFKHWKTIAIVALLCAAVWYVPSYLINGPRDEQQQADPALHDFRIVIEGTPSDGVTREFEYEYFARSSNKAAAREEAEARAIDYTLNFTGGARVVLVEAIE